MDNYMVDTVKSYKCNWCGKLHEEMSRADECALKHAKYNLANSLLEKGCSLETIEFYCNFKWKLKEEQKFITRDNCFIIEYWQCCKIPAYTIVEIEENGLLRLSGCGGWNGYYGDTVSLNSLPEPHVKEELYKYSR